MMPLKHTTCKRGICCSRCGCFLRRLDDPIHQSVADMCSMFVPRTWRELGCNETIPLESLNACRRDSQFFADHPATVWWLVRSLSLEGTRYKEWLKRMPSSRVLRNLPPCCGWDKFCTHGLDGIVPWSAGRSTQLPTNPFRSACRFVANAMRGPCVSVRLVWPSNGLAALPSS